MMITIECDNLDDYNRCVARFERDAELFKVISSIDDLKLTVEMLPPPNRPEDAALLRACGHGPIPARKPKPLADVDRAPTDFSGLRNARV
jgi:hypothetical protein